MTGGGAKKAKPDKPVTQPSEMAPKPNQRRLPSPPTNKTGEITSPTPEGRAITNPAALKAPRNSHAAATSTPTKTRAPVRASSPHTQLASPTQIVPSQTNDTAGTPSPTKKVNGEYTPNDVDLTCTLAIRPSPPRSPKKMANGRCPHICCEEFVSCGPDSFDRTRLGDGTEKYPGWMNYPKVCTGCKKDIKPGRKRADDDKNDITRVNASRLLQMCVMLAIIVITRVSGAIASIAETCNRHFKTPTVPQPKQRMHTDAR